MWLTFLRQKRFPNIVFSVSGFRRQAAYNGDCHNSSVCRYQRRNFFDAIQSIPHVIEVSMISIKGTLGLPWWLTFTVSTIIVRVGLLPLVRNQLIASRKLAGAMPELNFLFQLFKRRLSSINRYNISECLRIFSIFFKGVNSCLILHQASIFKVL